MIYVAYKPEVGVDSFGLGILVGIFGTISTIAAVLSIFVNNLRGVDIDGGNTLASSGGFVMPNFFFQVPCVSRCVGGKAGGKVAREPGISSATCAKMRPLEVNRNICFIILTYIYIHIIL